MKDEWVSSIGRRWFNGKIFATWNRSLNSSAAHASLGGIVA